VTESWACDESDGSCDWSCKLGAEQNCAPLECFGDDCNELTCKPADNCGDIANDIDIDIGVDVDFESNYFINIDADSSDSSDSSDCDSDSDCEPQANKFETEQRPVWGRIFQKKQAKQQSRRSRRSRYAQTSAVPTETKSDLEECMALQICTTSWYTTESLTPPEPSDSSSSDSDDDIWTWGWPTKDIKCEGKDCDP